MYNSLPYSYSGPIVYHIVHFVPLLPRGVKIGPTIHQVEPQRVQRLWQRMGRTYTYLSCSQQQLYLVVSQ